MGLRELKKARTRQAVQQTAMDLFAQQGYPGTTVEQIAAAAEISTATFYRYYRDKEDIVFGEDDSAVVEEVVAARPPDEPLAVTLGALFQRLAAAMEADKDAVLIRVALMHGVPGLQARRWATRQKAAELLARLLAPRTGRDPDDPQLRLAIAVALAAEAETVFYWARIGGTASLADLLAAALTTIEPVLRIRMPAREPRAGQAAVGSGPNAERTAADDLLTL
ncbi:MAG TPA: helix-turn-helix domain-containing protein [Streptosporangiaceae bacterium]|nr:helix-turn-helix domain-containing protein [Streptosporangiaceae bacterium]